MNSHYIRQTDDATLTDLVLPRLTTLLDGKLAEGAAGRVKMGMPGLKERAKNLNELAENAMFYAIPRPLRLNEKAEEILDDDARRALTTLSSDLASVEDWRAEPLQDTAKAFAEAQGLKLGKVALPLRAALTGTNVSPSIFDVMAVLGREETLARLKDAL